MVRAIIKFGFPVVLSVCHPALAGNFTTLAAITGNNDAASGSSGLVAVGGILYGAATTGGAFGRGALFSLDPSTGAERVVYSFTGRKDGATPAGTLTLVNGVLYGATNGVWQAAPNIFKFEPARGKLTTVYRFGTAAGTGFLSSLTLCNGILYGLNDNPSAFEMFSFDPATGVESTLYKSGSGSFKLSPPVSALTALNGVLYGTTEYGGANGVGDVFSFSPATGALAEVYEFTRTTGSLQAPAGPLTILNGSLYGLASSGGSNSIGGVFGVNPTTMTEQTILDFTPTTGSAQSGQLSALNGMLYGVMSGSKIFSLDPANGVETVIYSFTQSQNGQSVDPFLTPQNGVIYGTAAAGGQYGVGTIFGVNLQTGAETTFHSFAGVNVFTGVNVGLTQFNAGLAQANDFLYGTAQNGGANDHGSLFRLDPATGAISTIHAFTGQNDGGAPGASLAFAFGQLYGSTTDGGPGGNGTVFSIRQTGKDFTAVPAPAGNAAWTNGRLTKFGDALYGSYEFSGKYYGGSVVAVNPSTGAETTIYSFNPNTPSDGHWPSGALLAVGSKLWGVTQFGGTHGQGTIFTLDPVTGVETIAYNFAGSGTTLRDGSTPTSGLINVRGILYGTTAEGGYSSGTVYSFDPSTYTETVLYRFASRFGDGDVPYGSLAYYKGVFFGTTVLGGAFGQGTIYAIDGKTGAEKLLHDFNGYTDGGEPYAGLTFYGNTLFGMTNAGGTQNLGTIFSIIP